MQYDQTPGGMIAKAFGVAPEPPDVMAAARQVQGQYPDAWGRVPSFQQCLAAARQPATAVLDGGTSQELADRLSRSSPGWAVRVGTDPDRDKAMAQLGADVDRQLVTRPPRGSTVA